ncbi:ABC transporter permease [Pseudonocardia sp. HH130630-07]|uniref:ABC transporter permease n=1 Tax=Pseudonocardia sp. HH130630-07 TaxID=1690815 RepID=UPI000814F8D9|nr:ABC transporter permease [Pseudonocardia sp. HH130630-07]ANY07640.1 ABC transporter permease [Pseudonocardia sp. HH130630-07]
MGSGVVVGPPLAVALVVLVALAAAAAALGGTGTAWSSATAVARAVLQLGLVALVLLALVRSWWGTVAFVVLMVLVAAVTSGRRITGARGGPGRPGAAGTRRRWGGAAGRAGLVAGAAILAGVVPVLVVVLGSGAVPFAGIAVVPVAGIVIGGAMTATSLAGRRALDELGARHGEYEAALALGLLPRDAVLLVVRPTAGQALVPALDQTRTVGLVTLPGAFVGVLLGSGDPVQAAAAQLLVLAGLLAAETVAALVVVELVARGRIRRPVPAR